MNSSNPRLLVVGNDWGYFMTHRLPLVVEAVSQGYEVHVALPHRATPPPGLPTHLRFHGIDLDRGGVNPAIDARTFVDLVQLYRAVKPLLVHHFTIKPVLYGGLAARIVGVPVVINSMTGLGTLFASSKSWVRILRGIIVPMLRLACGGRRATTTFQNENDRELFVRLGICSASATAVIRGSGVDVALFRPSAEDPGTPVVMFVSRMLWDKGIREFVKAASMLQKSGIAARFVLVGGTDPNPTSVNIDQLRAWEEEGIVEWWGHTEKMQDVFPRAHIVCLPTYHEGLPKVLLEAASSGKPIVTTDIPGCRDIVRDGENGILVPLHDARSVADAIKLLLESPDLRARMGSRGRAIAVNEFATPIVIQAFMNLYRLVA